MVTESPALVDRQLELFRSSDKYSSQIDAFRQKH